MRIVDSEELEAPWQISEQGFPHGVPSHQALFLLRYAILAPSAHNSQPWRFDIQGNRTDFFIDRSRWLQVADPDQRELHISLGCALENFLIAARHFGLNRQVEYFPDPARPGLAARVFLSQGAAPASDRGLFDAILNRQTSRKAYKPDPLPQAVKDRLAACCDMPGLSLYFNDHLQARELISSLSVHADALQFHNPAFRHELIEAAEQGGYDERALVGKLGRLAAAFLNHCNPVVTPETDPSLTAPLVGILLTEENTPTAQLMTGQVFERIWLAAVAADLSLQPMTQLLQVPETKQQLMQALPLEPRQPQQIFRLGYAVGMEAEYTVRRPIETFLLNAAAI